MRFPAYSDLDLFGHLRPGGLRYTLLEDGTKSCHASMQIDAEHTSGLSKAEDSNPPKGLACSGLSYIHTLLQHNR